MCLFPALSLDRRTPTPPPTRMDNQPHETEKGGIADRGERDVGERGERRAAEAEATKEASPRRWLSDVPTREAVLPTF